MSYLPKNRGLAALARPNALVYIKSVASQFGQDISGTLPVKVNFDTPEVYYGDWTPSITNDIITLPQGYYYYIEQNQQIYMDQNFYNDADGTLQWYDEGNSTYIGTVGYFNKSNKVDALLESGDQVAAAFIDATSASFTVSARITSQYGWEYINAQQALYGYSGMGRQIIWRLDP